MTEGPQATYGKISVSWNDKKKDYVRKFQEKEWRGS
jgi:hypothetical protein